MINKSSAALRALLLCLPVVAAGCASVPQGAGFAEVQRSVAERLPQKVQWNRTTAEDEAVATAVRALLQDNLTVDGAVQIALLNNHTLQAEFERLGIAQADLVQAGLLSNPVFSAEFLHSAIGTERTFSVVEDFLNVFTRSARQKVAASAFEQVKLQVAARVLSLAAEVRSAYYTVAGDGQALELLQTVAQASAAAAELAKRQYQAGTLNRLNQNLQQTFYAQTVLERTRTETQLNSDREKLTRLMGLWGADVNWKVPQRLVELPGSVPAFENLEAQAVAQRLDLAASAKEIEAVAYALQMNHDYRWLNFLGIGFSTKRASDGESLRGPSIELGLPLFDQGQARIASLESQLRQMQQRRDALTVEIRSQVREAHARLRAVYEQVKYQRELLLPLNDSIVKETQLRYNGMLAGVYDLLLAKQGEINSARGYIQSLRDYWMAYTDLELALGGPLPGASPVSETLPAPAPVQAPAHEGGH